MDISVDGSRALTGRLWCDSKTRAGFHCGKDVAFAF